MNGSTRRRFPWHVLVFLAPAVLVYTAFSAWPLVDTLRLSAYGTGPDGAVSFVGLQNFLSLIHI